MFQTKNVAVTLAGARLNLQESDDEEIPIAELNLVIEPWPYDLLAELGDHAVASVFLKDRRVKPELRSLKIRPTYGRLQRFQFATALDASPIASIEPVTVEYLKFDRKENEKRGTVWIKGTIRVVMDYRDKAVRDLLAKQFGRRVFLSTIGLEGRLNFDAPTDAPAAPGRGPQLVITGPRAPEPDPAAGDVLDESSDKDDHAARGPLHTGRTGRRGRGDKDVH